VNTLVHKAKAHSSTLLVVQDAQGAVFGALITEHLKMGEKEKYYGNGTIAVWSFVSGQLQVRQCDNVAVCILLLAPYVVVPNFFTSCVRRSHILQTEQL